MQFHEFDGSYLERLCSGDFRTESHFVAYFSELIQLKLRSRVNSPQAIEDLRQETFARVFVALRSQGRLRQPERLGAFVNSVCNNVLLEHYRSSSRESSIEDEGTVDVPDPSLDVVSILSHKEMEQQVRQVLEELSERDRRLLRDSARSRFTTCAWMDTSSAETGSSHTTSAGSTASARAIPMR